MFKVDDVSLMYCNDNLFYLQYATPLAHKLTSL
jgi:hypothetical protein